MLRAKLLATVYEPIAYAVVGDVAGADALVPDFLQQVLLGEGAAATLQVGAHSRIFLFLLAAFCGLEGMTSLPVFRIIE